MKPSIFVTKKLSTIDSCGEDALSCVSDISASTTCAEDSSRGDWQSCAQPSVTGERLYGREKESRRLRDTYDRISRANALSEVVVVRGELGSGKTKLAESIRSYVTKNDHGYFVSGKFDEFPRNDPFCALTEAFTDLLDLIAQGNRMEHVQNELIAGGIEAVASLVTNLAVLDDQISAEASCSLLRAVACEKHPVVLFLDDLQFVTDERIMRNIDSIILDDMSKNLLIILSCNDSFELCKLSSIGASMHSSEEKDWPLVTDLRLPMLDIVSANELVSDLLNLDEVTTISLTDIIVQKTRGNIGHILEFVDYLKSKKLLVPSDIGEDWEWDIKRIQYETDVADNVADMLIKKLKNMEAEHLAILYLAACIGQRFKYDLLAQLVQREQLSTSGEDILRILSIASEESLIEHLPDIDHFKWSSSRVQNHLYSQKYASRKDDLHTAIGHLIMSQADSTEDNSTLIFQAVDHLNRGSCAIRDEGSLIEAAKYNLEAGKLVSLRSGCSSASSYFRNGLRYLKKCPHQWREEHYDACLEIYTLAAEVEYSCGNFEESSKLGYEVLGYAKNLNDKLRVYFKLINSLGSRAMFKDAMHLGYVVLKMLGEKFPSKASKLNVAFATKTVEKNLNGMQDVDLLKLPFMDDSAKSAALKVLNSMSQYAYWQVDRCAFASITLRMVYLTLKHGLDEYSPLAFANYALLVQTSGEYEEAFRFAMLAVRLLKKLKARNVEAGTLSIVYSFIMPWRRPLQDGIGAFERCVECGLTLGDLDSSFLGASGLLLTKFHTSTNLEVMGEDFKTYCDRMQAHGQQHHQLRYLLPCWKLQMCLVGDVDSPHNLSGPAFDARKMYNEYSESDDSLGIRTKIAYQLQLAYYFCDWKAVETLLPDLDKTLDKLHASHFIAIFESFFSAMAHYAVYKQTGNGGNGKAAQALTDKIQKRISQGAEHRHVILSLLNAEKVSLSNDTQRVQEAYEAAESAAACSGYLHLQAIAAERAGEVFLRLKDTKRARRYLQQSVVLYNEWGALAKAEYMEHTYPFLVSR
jgi:predicted ATPase